LNRTAAIARVPVAIPFLMSGIATQEDIPAMGVPAPMFAYLGSTLIEVGGSLLLILGYRVRSVAAALAAFTLLTAFLFHNNFADQNTMIHFLKNIAITGGLLQVVAYGAGAFSLDARRARRETVNITHPLSA
jgi:putative oxidoreductase